MIVRKITPTTVIPDWWRCELIERDRRLVWPLALREQTTRWYSPNGVEVFERDEPVGVRVALECGERVVRVREAIMEAKPWR